MPRLSVGIAGAGPAGLSAALFLARDGHIAGIVIDPRKTLRLDEKPTDLAGAPLAAAPF